MWKKIAAGVTVLTLAAVALFSGGKHVKTVKALSASMRVIPGNLETTAQWGLPSGQVLDSITMGVTNFSGGGLIRVKLPATATSGVVRQSAAPLVPGSTWDVTIQICTWRGTTLPGCASLTLPPLVIPDAQPPAPVTGLTGSNAIVP